MEKQISAPSVHEHSSPAQLERASAVTSEARNHLWIVLALLTLYLIWGSTYFFIRIAIVSIPPFLMTGVRLLVAGGVLYFILRLRGYPSPTRAEWGGSARMGLFLIGGGMGGVAFAEQWVASSVTAFCIATTPLWISIFSGFWGRWPLRAEWLGLVVGFGGVVLLNVGSGLWASPLGGIILLLSPMCWAFGSAWGSRLTLPKGLMASAAEMLLGGALLVAEQYAAPLHAETERARAAGREPKPILSHRCNSRDCRCRCAESKPDYTCVPSRPGRYGRREHQHNAHRQHHLRRGEAEKAQHQELQRVARQVECKKQTLGDADHQPGH